jgi:hypothetical protein
MTLEASSAGRGGSGEALQLKQVREAAQARAA